MGDNQRGSRWSRLFRPTEQDKARSSRSFSRPSTIGRLRSSRSGSLRRAPENWSLPRSRSTAKEEAHHAESIYDRDAVGKISLHLWLTAYENVTKAHPKMMDTYEKILTYHVGGDDQLSADITEEWPNRFVQLELNSRISKHQNIVSNTLQEAKNHSKLHQGVVHLSEFLTRNGTKIGNLMTAHPASALVWSGICVALQLVSAPVSQEKTLLEGLEYITNRMEWYLALTELLLEKSWKESSGFQRYREAMQKNVVEIYERLLELEIKSVCKCHERTYIARLLKGVLNLDSIEVAIEELKNLEGKLHQDAMQYTNKEISFHNEEAGDLVSWLTRSTAAKGGQCIISSGYTVYNVLAATRPDMVKTLAGSDWPFAMPHFHCRPIVFHHRGRLVINFGRAPLVGSASHPRATQLPTLSPKQLEALDAIETIARATQLEMVTQPGDIHVINNLAILHRREGFVDGTTSQERRHLVRTILRDEQLGWSIPVDLQDAWFMAFDPAETKRVWHIEPMPAGYFPLRAQPN